MRTEYSMEIPELARKLVTNIERVIVGKPEPIRQMVCALMSMGHLIIEDVPGVGKTMLARALVKSVDGIFRRIQFTADLLPSDITGANALDPASGQFHFREGPIFTNVLLADEINRATPRTQSSLLEAMEEGHATVDGVRYELPQPFLVVATQNPIELEGTYPLPFAQMDRFMVRIRLGYLDPVQEKEMLRARIMRQPLDEIEPVLSCEQIRLLQQATEAVTVSEPVVDYIVAVIQATRETPALEYGASPRGSLDLTRFSQALAILDGRDYVLPDDVKQSAVPVLAHRVIIRQGTRHATLSTDAVVRELLDSVPVPL